MLLQVMHGLKLKQICKPTRFLPISLVMMNGVHGGGWQQHEHFGEMFNTSIYLVLVQETCPAIFDEPTKPPATA